ncbi:ribonuclease HII [Flavobacteriaceae bacterium]|jgi:ribonuclease HII|nr:ribonuclease HII [Flavobacteriaceae bacterium]MDA9577016.1 ribonuclease HII [Flavobacteriaceae bacterium]MDA9833958.1 ribonuclease HII [Flavobacteriaceae bacterium]MDB4130034.1 ribonuclease HII [Flavobacteriaceae bacterium]MDB4266897.1 ribonuclease HII [Flavobacteriaceae bacterium]
MLKTQYTLSFEAGTDEAGRGCLAGPVTAAAVILPKKNNLPLLNDSKKLTEKQRYALRPEIEKQALAYAVAHVYQEEIDEINILNASIKAMHLALKQLSLIPEFIVVDGNRFKQFEDIPHACVVKGDGKYQNIAAASVLAKTYRDDYMKKLDTEFPQYNWNKNKGYPTKKHREAIATFGITVHHRISFQLLSKKEDI